MGSTLATGVATGVMAPQVLGGPIWWLVFGVYVLAIALAIFVVADTFRPVRRERFSRIPEPDWLYAGFAAIFLVAVVVPWVPGVPRVVAAVPVILTPFALGFGVAYLLRVVFPKPESGAGSPGPTDSSAVDDGGLPDDGESVGHLGG